MTLFLTVIYYKFLLKEHNFYSGPRCFCGFNHLNFRYTSIFFFLCHRIIGLYLGLVFLTFKFFRGIMQVSLEQMKSTDLSTVDGVFQVSVLQNS